jgi:phospholipid/cholesterol/gamma-HCH transport system substrate-binding protein
MITRRTKVQLLIFVLITLLGVSYVGARYARLDRLVLDDSYTVVAHFPDSGGIFAGGEVSYRGVRIGQVGKLQLTDSGVDVYMDIDKSYDTIPSDALAVVGNRSAVGEQYVELQPQVDTEPYLHDDSEIAAEDTRTPIPTQKLLGDISTTVESVNKKALSTTVTELGEAFGGTGQDLQRIIDTGNEFIKSANANFDTTSALIRDSNTVLHGQIDSASAIRSFARDLSLFSGTLAGSDKSLRAVIDNGSATATQLRTFLEDNEVDLGELINNLVTTGDVVVKHLPGIEQVLVVYPYVVEGGFTVVSKSPDTGLYDAHFGMVLTQDPKVCEKGYESTNVRPPQDGSNAKMNEQAHCAEPPTVSNARGAQNAPRAGAAYRAPAGPHYRGPVVASYDPVTGHLSWGAKVDPALGSPGTPAPSTLGEESWKWLFLQPLVPDRR